MNHQNKLTLARSNQLPERIIGNSESSFYRTDTFAGHLCRTDTFANFLRPSEHHCILLLSIDFTSNKQTENGGGSNFLQLHLCQMENYVNLSNIDF
jgi:hypothetical protein